MKKQLLLFGILGMGLTAVAAEVPTPISFEAAYISGMSANGEYAVSQTSTGVKIFNLATGEEKDYLVDPDDWSGMAYTVGLGKCVSNNGIVVGGTDVAVQYWKDGEWYDLEVPEYATSTNLANAITPDGKRICGSIGVSELVFDGDGLMQVPCIWNATDKGYGEPVMLPHPDKDFTGRVPQYVTAVDISDDGKVIIGQVMSATGMIAYPILYKENEKGEWSYEIVHENFLMPEGTVFPEYPGDGPEGPNITDFMTEEESQAYNDAVSAYFAGESTVWPEASDYMTKEEIAAYEEAEAKFQVEYEEWSVKFNAWFEVMDTCLETCPGYVFNSVLVSPDGLYYGCTIEVKEKSEPGSWFPFGSSSYNVWVFDVNSNAITKYDQNDDFNLTYLANNGVALAATSIGGVGNSFVLSNGDYQSMFDWMNSKCPEYASWIKENMTFSFEEYVWNDEIEDYDLVVKEEMMTGRPISTPDLSMMALSVPTVWDYATESIAFFFDMKAADSVDTIRPESEEMNIYDLSGLKLKSAKASGIYIINGKKVVVR